MGDEQIAPIDLMKDGQDLIVTKWCITVMCNNVLVDWINSECKFHWIHQKFHAIAGLYVAAKVYGLIFCFFM